MNYSLQKHHKKTLAKSMTRVSLIRAGGSQALKAAAKVFF